MVVGDALALTKEEDGGCTGVCLVLFEFEDSNGGSLCSKGSAAEFAVLPIPSLEVKEVRQSNPVART